MSGRVRIVGLDSGERTSAEAQVKKKTQRWSMPQDQINRILSWDVSDFVSPTLGSIDTLPSDDENKERLRAEELNNIAVMQGARRRKREIQQFIRDELARQGYVVIELDK